MKDNKTIEIVFLKNESRTVIIFVSKIQSQNMSILGRSLPGIMPVSARKGTISYPEQAAEPSFPLNDGRLGQARLGFT